MEFLDRKGQVINVDFSSEDEKNYSKLIIAKPGAGMSFINDKAALDLANNKGVIGIVDAGASPEIKEMMENSKDVNLMKAK